MERPRRRSREESIEDTAIHTSSDNSAHTSEPQSAGDNTDEARSTSPITVGRKASKGRGTVRGRGRGTGRRLRADVSAASKIEYNPSAIWRPGDPKLESWQFHDKERTGVLRMIDPWYNHDRHFYMLTEGEKSTSRSTRVPEEDRTQLTGEDAKTATSWSDYFYDALYGHPQAIFRPEREAGDCRILGLFNGDLIIDSASRSRPLGMYWTFNPGTRMLQHIKPCGMKRPSGMIKEPEISIDQVGRFIGHKGPAPDFGRFPPARATRFRIEINGDKIISFDTGMTVGGDFVREPESAHMPRERSGSSRQVEVYRVTIGDDGKPTNLAVLKTKEHKRARFALDGPDDSPSHSSSSSSSDSSGPSDASRASKRRRKRPKAMTDPTSEASSMFLTAYSTSIYEGTNKAAFNAVLGLKRRPEDTLNHSPSKLSRILLSPGDKTSHVLEDGPLNDKTVATASNPYLELYGRSIYESARRAALTALMKKRKAEDGIDEPSFKRSCPDNSERGERERFDALRAVVGPGMATAIKDMLRSALRTESAGFRRLKRIPWSPSPSEPNSDNDHDDDDPKGHRGVLRETGAPSGTEQDSEDGEDEDDDRGGNEGAIRESREMSDLRQRSDKETTPVAENDRTMGRSGVDWAGHPPVQRDEDDDVYVIRTDDWSPNGRRAQMFKERGNEIPGDKKDGTNSGETQAKTDQDDGKKNTAKAKEVEKASVVNTYNYKSVPPLPRRPNGNEAYECPPERPEDDYMMSGALGPESPVRDPVPTTDKTTGDGKDGAKGEETEADTNQDVGNKRTDDSEPVPDEFESDPREGTEPEVEEPEIGDPESPIDDATLHLIIKDQVDLELHRTMLRNIAAAHDPVASERLKLEEEAKKAIKEAESREFEQSLLEDSDGELSGFDDGSDDEDEGDEADGGEAVTDEES